MEALLGLATAFGISGPAGLNAYLTLLSVGLLARFTDLLHLRAPFDVLTNEWVLGVLVVLVLIELFVDKVPGLDSVNDAISTFIRPVAGAIVFAGDSNVISDINPAFGAIVGLLAAGSVHAIKATSRPVIQVATAGTGGAVVSVIEDVMVVVTVVLSVIAPVVAVLVAATGAWLLVRWYRGRRRSRPEPVPGA